VAVTNTARERERWAGFALPGSLVVGFLLLRTVADAFALARPSPWLDWQFLNDAPSFSIPAEAGIYPAIIGSVFLIALVAVLTFALGVGAAIYLEEYAPSGGRAGTMVNAIRVNISNLAGVPSVVYGLLGLGIFVNLEYTLGAFGVSYTYAGIGVGTVLTAAFTLSLLILPIVIIAAQEALRSVPDSLRQASYGMGATKWQTTRNVVLPRAMPGILTGTILALGRAIGETAPLIMIGAATAKFSPPTDLFSKLTAMPLQIFTTAFLPGDDFQRGVTAAGVVALLVVLLTMNSVAILLRNKFESEA
jgi:phosphate transport system permease protein